MYVAKKVNKHTLLLSAL